MAWKLLVQATSISRSHKAAHLVVLVGIGGSSDVSMDWLSVAFQG